MNDKKKIKCFYFSREVPIVQYLYNMSFISLILIHFDTVATLFIKTYL